MIYDRNMVSIIKVIVLMAAGLIWCWGIILLYSTLYPLMVLHDWGELKRFYTPIEFWNEWFCENRQRKTG